MPKASRSQLIERAKMLLPPRRAESTIPGRSDNMEEILLRVLSELAIEAKTNDDLHRQLTKTTTFTLDASSEYSMTGVNVADILPEGWETAELYVAGFARAASYCRDYATWALGTPRAGIVRVTIAHGKILVRAATLAQTALKVCTLRDALFIPYVDEVDPETDNTLPENLEDDVVTRMVAKQLERLGVPALGAA